MDEREALRALVDDLTDEEVAEALEYLRFLVEERRASPADGTGPGAGPGHPADA
jgi:hypothetical protein